MIMEYIQVKHCLAKISHSCFVLLIVSPVILVCLIIGGTKFDHFVKVVLMLVAFYR